MISRIVVLPSPPLLVPELTVVPTPEVQRLRDACLHAVSSLTDYATEWVGVGTDQSAPRVLSPEMSGSFAGFGVDVPVTLRRAAGDGTNGTKRETGAAGGERAAEFDPSMPLPGLIAGWFRHQVDHPGVRVHLVDPGACPETAIDTGHALASSANEQALLVVADGSNRRNEQSPYSPDPRAFEFDEGVRCALANADHARLRRLDPDLAAELGVTGRAALQALAGAVDASGGTWRARLQYESVPFGVVYHVVVWDRVDQ